MLGKRITTKTLHTMATRDFVAISSNSITSLPLPLEPVYFSIEKSALKKVNMLQTRYLQKVNGTLL